MEAIGSTFDNFNLVVNSFQFRRVDGIYSMIDEPIGIARKPFSKLRELFVSRNHSLAHPGLEEGDSFNFGFAIPEHFKFILKDIDCIKGLVYAKKFFEPFLLRDLKIFLVLKQKISRALYNLLSRVRCSSVFLIPNPIKNSGVFSYYVELIKDHIGLRSMLKDTGQVGIPHVRCNCYDLLGSCPTDLSKKLIQGLLPSSLLNPDDLSYLQIQNHSQVSVPRSVGELIYGQDLKAGVIRNRKILAKWSIS